MFREFENSLKETLWGVFLYNLYDSEKVIKVYSTHSHVFTSTRKNEDYAHNWFQFYTRFKQN
jgi:hypothetical protein